ncbi:MAG: long-chain fatty acid transport protein [Arenicella sp.]|jgi:long-chain fatty acid transport protein
MYKVKIMCASLIVSAAIAPNIANATNGLYGHGYGARQSGIAGSGVAFPQDGLIAAINPAGVVHLEKSREIDLQYFSPRREYTVTGSQFSGAFPPFPGPTVESGSETFIIPAVGLNWALAEDSAIGLAIYGNGGMNSDYKASNTPFGFGTYGAAAVPGATADTGVDYQQLFVNLSYSKKFGSGNSSWGIAAIANYSLFEATGLAGFGAFSVSPANLSDNGADSDFGLGFRLGMQYEVSSSLVLAASYQSEISNSFDDYAGLFPEGGKLHIPATAQIGLAVNTSSGTITADIQQIYYDSTEGVGDPGSTGLPTGCFPSRPFTSAPIASGPSCIGGTPGLGFGWEDMTVFKLGYTWDTSETMTWRVGASYGDQPVQAKDVTFNILAPGVVEQHYTAGFTKTLESGNAFSLSLMVAPENCIDGPDLFTPGQSVELCMNQVAVNAGFSF